MVIELIKFRVAMWVKAKWPDIALSHSDVARCLMNVIPPAKPANVRRMSRWAHHSVLLNLMLTAIREALLIFISAPWIRYKSLIIESDSSVAVEWVRLPSHAPWRVRKSIVHIENLKKQVGIWSIVHTVRECNVDADVLAKEGLNRTEDFVWIADE
ncbi:hypothetical protein DITRI_Ditri01bG0168600 [Diplodiscus trichospermus]